ncbi:MAG TPA: response regulator transcription factor [Bryobacteraceae bacterium]|nr:response regulator transcription factor [Bryobacteraceae bacterium]
MPRILIVEDDAAIAIALEDDLRLEGYEVEVVRDGEAAIKRGGEAAFELIVLDVMLPKKDGFDVCRELRRTGVASMILLLTARTAEIEKVLGLDLGADDYMTKPYSPKELRARIRALLRRTTHEAGATATMNFGDCELDLNRGELRRAGKVVATTPLEFKLLGLMARRAGRVLTRRVLIDEVWGKETAITERVVDNQIANLRKKIEPTPDQPQYLKSVRGIGYRFDVDDVTQS